MRINILTILRVKQKNKRDINISRYFGCPCLSKNELSISSIDGIFNEIVFLSFILNIIIKLLSYKYILSIKTFINNFLYLISFTFPFFHLR